MSNRPIGIFDSGLGGLSVVNALTKLLPHEDIVYFGDTGRVPYGTRSKETIAEYTAQDIGFLQSKGVKLIIAACGTVSSVAAHVGKACGTPFLEVVTPTAKAAVQATKNKKIGIIGTAATVASNSYAKIIETENPHIQVFGQPCPLFVPLVEEGFIEKDDILPFTVCERYLAPLQKEGVDTLILGCTHFPLLAPIIGQVMGENVTLIDSGLATARYAVSVLENTGLLNPQTAPGKQDYFVSDRAEAFCDIAGRFLGRDIPAVTKVVLE